MLLNVLQIHVFQYFLLYFFCLPKKVRKKGTEINIQPDSGISFIELLFFGSIIFGNTAS